MINFTNKEKIEGRVYQHNLTLKTVQNPTSANYGKPFIGGTLDVATNEFEDALNVITINYTYVPEYYKSGKKNNTFTNLKRIIEEDKTWINVGKDEAIKVSCNTNLGLKEFYSNDDEFISVKSNEGGFVNIIDNFGKGDKATFTVDFLINGISVSDEGDVASLNGAAFDGFRQEILPMSLTLKDAEGIKYFENLDPSPAEPVLTRVWGEINSTTVTEQKEEETAFGIPAIQETKRSVKNWTVTGCQNNPYDYGEESNILTPAEVTKMLQDREMKKADIKKQKEEYEAKQQNNNNPLPFAGSGMNKPTMGANPFVNF